MPQGSRKGSRSNNNNSNNNTTQKQNETEKVAATPLSNVDNHYMLKHAHIPAIPNCNMVLFHFILLIFSLTSTMMQYLHIYRTVWWLPQSHAKKALNFYLIDPHLFGYLITIEVVPFLYSIYNQIIQIQKKRIVFLVCISLCTLVWIVWLLAFVVFSCCVYMKTTGFYLLILFYPPIAYGVIYCHYLPQKILCLMRSRVVVYATALRLFVLGSCSETISSPGGNGQTDSGFATVATSSNNSVGSGVNESLEQPATCVGISSVDYNSVTGNIITNTASATSTISPKSKAVQKADQRISESGSTSNTNAVGATSSNISIGGSISSSNTALPNLSQPNVLPCPGNVNGSNPSPTQLALEQYGIFYYSKTVRNPGGTCVQHSCTMNPEEVRDEVERLKADFNRKFRDIFFGTLFTFFYAALVPLLFVPKPVLNSDGSVMSAVHYDGAWCGQHVFVTAVTAFLLYSVQHLSPAYVDVLHRCALHLGRWRREEGRSANVPYNPWSQLQMFPRGALVKHVRGLFRAVGAYNSAEPGNNMHNRFFCFFYPALRLPNVMCVLVLVVLALQYALLLHNYEWYKIISAAGMMFFNVCSLYKILRNRFLLGRCYREECVASPSGTAGPSTTVGAPVTSVTSQGGHMHHLHPHTE